LRMLKISRNMDVVDLKLKESAAPVIILSPKIASTSVKRGFKSNASAAFLKRRFSPEKTPNTDEAPTQLETTKLIIENKDLKADNSPEGSEGKENTNLSTTDGSDSFNEREKLLEKDDESLNLPHKCYRVMLVGAQGVGKRGLIDSFSLSDCFALQPQKRTFDLVVKTSNDGISHKHYRFWLKTPDQTSTRYQVIYKLYYEQCSTIFLLYDESNKESIDTVELELASLFESKRREKNLNLVLVNNTQNTDNLELSPQIQNIQEKYNIKSHVTWNHTLESSKDILSIIENSFHCLV